jgi:hypothetical protein
MSADLFLQLLIFLETFSMLCPEETMECKDRLVPGLLLSVPASEAKELTDKYDEDGDGQFDNEEIAHMASYIHAKKIAGLAGFDKKAEEFYTKLHEKEKACQQSQKLTGLKIGDEGPVRNTDLEVALDVHHRALIANLDVDNQDI